MSKATPAAHHGDDPDGVMTLRERSTDLKHRELAPHELDVRVEIAVPEPTKDAEWVRL